MGLFQGPKGRGELGSWHPTAQNPERPVKWGLLWGDGRRVGRGRRTPEKAEGWRRPTCLMGRRLVRASPPNRVKGREAEWSEVQSLGV